MKKRMAIAAILIGLGSVFSGCATGEVRENLKQDAADIRACSRLRASKSLYSGSVGAENATREIARCALERRVKRLDTPR